MIETKEQTIASMTIRYQLTIDDWLAFNRFYHTTSHVSRNQMRTKKIAFSFIVMCTSFLTLYAITKTINLAFIIGVIFVGLFSYIGIAKFFVTRLYKNARKIYESGQNKMLREVRTLTISPNYIETQSSLAENRMKWPLVEKVAVDNEYIFIFISANQAVIIPNRAFQHETQRQEFIALINSYHTVKYA